MIGSLLLRFKELNLPKYLDMVFLLYEGGEIVGCIDVVDIKEAIEFLVGESDDPSSFAKVGELQVKRFVVVGFALSFRGIHSHRIIV